jgi:catechol 2,3-dioxygenase-like lactoylglutathione lyase family enzyme
MAVNFALDHIVILVRDLDWAIADYTALGFTVVRGGEHQGGATHNALVAFADDTYLELVAFRRPPLPADQTSPGERRFRLREAAGEGLIDFALSPSDIAAAVEEAARRGLTLEGPLPGGRVRPDGQQIAWQLAIPETLGLPFLCADVTPRALRVPQGEARRHANGVMGVASVIVAGNELEEGAERYSRLLGMIPRPTSQPAEGRTYQFVLGYSTLAVASHDVEASLVSEHLAARGEGPYRVLLHTRDSARVGRLDSGHTHGAWIELVAMDNPSN